MVNFIADVLVPIDVCIPFTQAPASLNYHHNNPGGLLEHTVEVAEIVAELPFKTQVEIDLAITGALLHDIGKIKSMDGRMSRMETGKWVDHGALTLEICSYGLAKLGKHNSLFANILRHIWTCKSPGARYGYESKRPLTHSNSSMYSLMFKPTLCRLCCFFLLSFLVVCGQIYSPVR